MCSLLYYCFLSTYSNFLWKPLCLQVFAFSSTLEHFPNSDPFHVQRIEKSWEKPRSISLLLGLHTCLQSEQRSIEVTTAAGKGDVLKQQIVSTRLDLLLKISSQSFLLFWKCCYPGEISRLFSAVVGSLGIWETSIERIFLLTGLYAGLRKLWLQHALPAGKVVGYHSLHMANWSFKSCFHYLQL